VSVETASSPAVSSVMILGNAGAFRRLRDNDLLVRDQPSLGGKRFEAGKGKIVEWDRPG